jgi:tripartite ATP-independent transporter DctP family solute receptor
MTTRRMVLLGAGALAAGCSPPRISSPLHSADVHRSDYPTVQAVKWMSDELARATDGRLQIQVYPAGQIGSEDASVGLARMGAIDFARVTAATLNNRAPLTRMLCLPYLMQSDDHFHRVADGPVGAQIRDSFAGTGLVALALYDGGLRCIYNVRHPITTPKDLAGLRIRVPQSDLFIRSIAAMGANPTPLTVSYVFQALSTHLIDGAENNWPTYESARHVELAKYWSQTLHCASPDILTMSEQRYRALSASDQDLIRDVATRSVAVMRTAWTTLVDTAREKALSLGATVSETDRAAFAHATEAMVRDEAERLGQTAMLAQIRELAP